MTKNKYIIAALCAATAMGFAQEANEMPPVVAGITTAKEYKYDVSRRYVGRVVAEESVAVVAQVAGEIKEVCFKEGDIVEKGAVLYKLDDVKYTAAVKAAEASVAQAQANFDYAKKTFDRTTVLFERKVASANDMDAAVNGFNSAQAGLEAAKANLILAQDNLAHATITSPIKGRIGANTFTVGNYISLSSGVLTTVVKVDPYVFSVPSGRGDTAERIYPGSAEYPVPDAAECEKGTAHAETGPGVQWTDDAPGCRDRSLPYVLSNGRSAP
ncbi:MAG: efflux RND transporter periplasmic adaptor subunit [Kiritimatiellae bacterium]|nr:efflux RND transporter periplasmic adaptor subunit [Kiritimatiellia bacterium]